MSDRLMDMIETAIGREEEAYAFYMELRDKVVDDEAKEALQWMANEELKHKKFLVKYRNGDLARNAMGMSDVTYYRIAEYQKEPPISEQMSPQDVFLVAAHRELKSHHFYSELAELHPGGEVKDVLLKMANEELKHKEKMEYLYANTAFAQTSGG